jgi:hypothetical protein
VRPAILRAAFDFGGMVLTCLRFANLRGALHTAPPAVNAAMKTLYQNILKLRLDVSQHVPIHVRVGSSDEFLEILGRTQ